MIKMVYAWRDRADLGAEASERNWWTGHAPLARAAYDGVPGFQALVYNRVRSARVNDYNTRDAREVESDIDAYVELYFDDEASLVKSFERPQLAAMFEDHVNFMETDVPANVRIYEVHETVVLGERQDRRV